MPVTLAFYKGRGHTRWERLQDTFIRVASRGEYSHVELIAGTAQHQDIVECLSSSARDGGVREKSIHLKPENWELVELRIDPDKPAQFIRDRIGAQYDFLGIIFSQVLALGRHNETKWFCSEICGAALGMPRPHRISPQLLFEFVTYNKRKN